jgi:hypothetical protein
VNIKPVILKHFAPSSDFRVFVTWILYRKKCDTFIYFTFKFLILFQCYSFHCFLKIGSYWMKTLWNIWKKFFSVQKQFLLIYFCWNVKFYHKKTSQVSITFMKTKKKWLRGFLDIFWAIIHAIIQTPRAFFKTDHSSCLS